MNIERLLQDYNIPYASEGHQHCTDGWVNIHCPFCAGQQNFHLGIGIDHGGCHCWKCGGHSIVDVLMKVLNLPASETRKVIQKYERGGRRPKKSVSEKIRIHPFKFPTPNSPLSPLYKDYLIRRKFDPELLEKTWGLFQTGPISYLDEIPYSHRIVIPIYWNDEIVSFQARDITDKSDRKYLACPKKREKIHHKNILYGKQNCWADYKAILIVEGVTDVWRFGECSAATFGIEFKTDQVLQLAKHHSRFFVIFDEQPEAQKQARKLMIKLKALGKEAYVVSIKGDPGGMDISEANRLVKELST